MVRVLHPYHLSSVLSQQDICTMISLYLKNMKIATSVKYFSKLDEVDAHGFLLLHGNLEILSGQQESLQILNEGPNGLWFGDEQLFCSTERDISAKAHTPCIVATFSRSNFKVCMYI